MIRLNLTLPKQKLIYKIGDFKDQHGRDISWSDVYVTTHVNTQRSLIKSGFISRIPNEKSPDIRTLDLMVLRTKGESYYESIKRNIDRVLQLNLTESEEDLIMDLGLIEKTFNVRERKLRDGTFDDDITDCLIEKGYLQKSPKSGLIQLSEEGWAIYETIEVM